MNALPQSPYPFQLRDLPRLGNILRVAVEKGWGHYLERLHLQGCPPGGEVPPQAAPDTRRLREALDELGPTFVKFGQMLSVRQDLFPPAVIAELEKLQDAVPAFSAEEAHRIIEEELHRPLAELFPAFDDVPLAAASIAQVHAAELADGVPVIVKVQRPGIEALIRADIDILFFIARLLQKHIPESRRYDPLGLVEEFSDTISRELDFGLEGRNSERFSKNFSNEPMVYVPRVFWPVSGRRVLTMERSYGHRVTPDYSAATSERKRLADGLARLFLVQLFEHGFFHGDPHPGNVFVMDDGRLCFHDFGIVGRLLPRDQESLRQLLLALVVRDAGWLADIYADMGVAAATVDHEAFSRDLEQGLEDYYAAAARSASFGEILRQFIQLGRRHEIHFPRPFLLVSKAFMAVESLAHSLDPEFNMVATFRRYAPELIGRAAFPTMSTTTGLAQGYRAVALLRELASGLPQALTQGLHHLQKGEAALRVRHEHLEELEGHIDRASNRLSFALIIAAVLVASSIMVSIQGGPHYLGIPLLALAGYILAAVLGLWWAVAILRSGKL